MGLLSLSPFVTGCQKSQPVPLSSQLRHHQYQNTVPGTHKLVKFRADEFGRRETFVSNPASRRQFALFFGGSNITGFVPYDKTLPSQFGRVAPQIQPYNYAYRAPGPGNLLDILRHSELEKEVTQETGVAFYFHREFMIDRVVGDSSYVSHSGDRMPWFELEGNRLVYQGSFADAKPMTYWIRSLLDKLSRLWNVPMRLPLSKRSVDFKKMCLMVKEAETAFLRQKPKAEFFVVVDFHEHEQRNSMVEKCFRSKGLTLLSLHRPFKKNRLKYVYSTDPHYNEAGLKRLAVSLWLNWKNRI